MTDFWTDFSFTVAPLDPQKLLQFARRRDWVTPKIAAEYDIEPDEGDGDEPANPEANWNNWYYEVELLDGDPTRVWFHTSESGDPYVLAEMLLRYIRKHDRDLYTGFSYAGTASKSLAVTEIGDDVFCGGAIFISRSGLRYIDAKWWLHARVKRAGINPSTGRKP